MGQLSSKLRSVAYGDRPAIAWWCPGCSEMHQVTTDAPKGWKFDRNLEAPTIEPSVLVSGVLRLTEDEYRRVMAGENIGPIPKRCHCFIRAGQIQFLDDCTHWLRGQTVDLPDLPEALTDTQA